MIQTLEQVLAHNDCPSIIGDVVQLDRVEWSVMTGVEMIISHEVGTVRTVKY